MKRALFLAILATALVVVPAALTTTPPKTSYAFGRSGGNIRPQTTTITSAGVVHIAGAPDRHVSVAKRTELRALVRSVKFFSLPTYTNCPGAHPDVAARFVKVTLGTQVRTVTVHGSCVPRFQKLATALNRAAGLTIS
jgi:hypothetical protein